MRALVRTIEMGKVSAVRIIHRVNHDPVLLIGGAFHLDPQTFTDRATASVSGDDILGRDLMQVATGINHRNRDAGVGFFCRCDLG